MKMIKTITLALLAMTIFLATNKLAAMELPQPKNPILKLQHRDDISADTDAALLDPFGRKDLLKVFGHKPAINEPCIFLNLQNWQPQLSEKQIADYLKRLEKMGHGANVLAATKKTLSCNPEYVEVLVPISLLTGKKQGNTVAIIKNKGIAYRCIYHDSEHKLTDQIESDMTTFGNNPLIRFMHPTLADNDDYRNSVANELIAHKIVAQHNGQLIHGTRSYFASIPANPSKPIETRLHYK